MAGAKLYTYHSSFRSHKIEIASKYSKTNLTTVSEGPEFVFGETNKSDEFLQKFPLGKVPAFESGDKNCLFETNAIAHYVGNDQLRGKSVWEQAQIIQWISFADNEILPSACTWVFPCLGVMQYNKQGTEIAKDVIKRCLNILNTHLLTRTYLVGERITQADISVVCNLLQLYTHVLEPAFRQPYSNVNRWFITLVNQPEFRTVLGEVKLCEKMEQFDAKKFAEIQGKSKEKSKGKEEKPAKEEGLKTDKKPAPVEEPDPEEDEPFVKEAPKKDPFEQFPKGKFVMDDFKRVYSNESEEKSIPYFWDKFDKENYTIWYCEYKYPEELTLTFMSCNLIGGMFQRLDKMRKHAFASCILFGEDNKSTISGIWVWRGHELAFPLSEDWQIDYESYDWKKLDPDSPATKKMVNEYFGWSGDFGGKKFNQGKIFK